MAIFLLLFVILVLLFSIPAVQTKLGKYATKKLNEDFGTNINIERVGLQFNGDVELKQIYIEDYKQDTLLSIEELNTSVLSFKKLYNNKLTFGDIDLYGVIFNLKTYKGEDDTNLDVFVARFDEDKPDDHRSDFLLSSSDVSIDDMRFTLSDENRDPQQVFRFNNLDINATNFLISGPDVSARINKLAFEDSRGVKVKSMTTNFTYTREEMVFEYLQIKTENSILKGDLRFDYVREDLQYFVDKVKLQATFSDSKIALDELNKFYNEFGIGQVATLNTTLYGTLNNLTASQLDLRTSRQTIVDGNITFNNLFSKASGDFKMDATFNRLTSTYQDLKTLLPNVLGNSLPSSLDNLKKFNIKGSTNITSKDIKAKVDIESELGLIFSDLKMTNIQDIDNASYKGKLIFDEFKLGEFINDKNIGAISFNLDVDGKGFKLEKLNTKVIGTVFGLDYKKYYYSDVVVSGNIKNRIFDGQLKTKDKNIDFEFDGLVDYSKKINHYDFTANVKRADLKALNFVTNDSISHFQGIVNMDMKGTNYDDAFGNINFKNTIYKNENDEYFFKDFSIASRFENNIRYIDINSPDIIEGSLHGKFRIDDTKKLIENALGNIYTNYQAHEIKDNQFIDFNFKIYNKIVEVFYPEINFGQNTFIRGRVESDAEKFNLTFKSPQIKYGNDFANDIQLKIDNKNPLFNTYIEVDNINSSVYNVSDFSLINVTLQDTLFIKTEFNGGKDTNDNFDLNLYYTINEESKSVIGFKKSEVNFKNNKWFINDQKDRNNKIVFDRLFKSVLIDNIKMNHENEKIELFGELRDSTYKDINLDFKNVDLKKITPEIDSLSLAGNVNGKLNVKQQNNIYLPESNVTIDDFTINNYNLGSFRANIIGNESLTNYKVDVKLKDDLNESLAIKGDIDVSGRNSTMDLNIKFKDFLLDPLNPFGEGVITQIRGNVDGNARVFGSIKRPDIYGNLTLNQGGLSIPYLNVNYQFEDNTKIALQEQSFILNNAKMFDVDFNSNADISGKINHINLSKWSLSLDIDSQRFLVLNTQDSEDALYYGTAYVNGNVDISGPTDQLVIKAEVTSEEGTIFKIPLNDTNTFENSYIHFLSPEEKQAKISGEEIVIEDIKGLELDFDLSVNENAEIEIVIDKASGSTIKGRGNGGLLAQINTNGKFNMYGDFIVSEGVYNFVYRKIIQKKFEVLPGGTLVWEGDPLKAEINIKALHEGITANPSVLLDNPINQSIPVEVEVHLTSQLEKPDVNFDVRFPNVNTTLNTELKDRLRDKDKREFQALSLLATGSFRSELTLNSKDAFGIVSDGVTNILNEIISDGNDKFNVNLDLEIGETRPEYETDSRVGFALSTKLSDRVLINGKVGVPIGGVSESTVAGDFEVEVLLNEDRTLSLKFFNRENTIRYFGEQIGYTQGVGLSYNVEFDNLKELFNKLFTKKNAKTTEIKKVLKNKESGLPEYIEFKE